MRTKTFMSASVALLISGAIILSSVSADDTAGGPQPMLPQNGRMVEGHQEGRMGDGRMSEGMSPMASMNGQMNNKKPMLPMGIMIPKECLSGSLIAEDIATLTGLIATQRTEFKSLIDSFSGSTLTGTGKDEQVKTLLSSQITELQAYIAPEKQEKCTTMMEKGLEMLIKNHHGAMEKNVKKEMKRVISSALRGKLLSALDKIPDAKKEVMYTKILANIKKMVEKITASDMNSEKKTRVLAQLEEIGAIVQEKLDGLIGSTDDISIDEVLSGDTTSTSTGGTTDTTTSTGTTTTDTTTSTGTTTQ